MTPPVKPLTAEELAREFMATLPLDYLGTSSASTDELEAECEADVKRLAALLPTPVGQAADAGALAPAWRTISSAPKDGTKILGYYPDAYQGKGSTFAILWFEREFVTVPGNYRHMKFTHWQPLPAPPSSSPRAAELDTPKAR